MTDNDGIVIPFQIVRSLNSIVEGYQEGGAGDYSLASVAIRETIRGFALTFVFERGA